MKTNKLPMEQIDEKSKENFQESFNSVSKQKELKTCQICFQKVSSTAQNYFKLKKCLHRFHKDCLISYIQRVETAQKYNCCPSCKLPYSSEKVLSQPIFQESNISCVICYSSYTSEAPPISLPCQHFYHESCIKEWMKNCQSTVSPCPYCRKNFEERHITIRFDILAKLLKSRGQAADSGDSKIFTSTSSLLQQSNSGASNLLSKQTKTSQGSKDEENNQDMSSFSVVSLISQHSNSEQQPSEQPTQLELNNEDLASDVKDQGIIEQNTSESEERSSISQISNLSTILDVPSTKSTISEGFEILNALQEKNDKPSKLVSNAKNINKMDTIIEENKLTELRDASQATELEINNKEESSIQESIIKQTTTPQAENSVLSSRSQKPTAANQNKEDNIQFQVFVKDLNGQSFIVEVTQNLTIEKFTKLVSLKTNIDISQLRFSCEGKGFSIQNFPQETIGNFKVKKNSTVYVLLKLKGG